MRTHWRHACCLALLCACTAPPALIVPDGRQRTPANRPEAIERYRAQQTQRRQSPASAPTEQERRIDRLERQLHELRQQLAQPANERQPEAAIDAVGDGTELVIGASTALFRLPQPLGKIDCQGRPALHAVLLETALLSRRIAIHGHTDAERGDAINRRLAMGRALCARQMLLAAGVQSSRIRTTYHAAGGFVAENSTIQGKARNRRIEVELHGLDAGALTVLASFATRSTP